MLTVVAVLAGTLVGWVLTRLLASLGYRRPEEAERPAPANRWWLIPAVGAAWGWIVVTLAKQPEAVIVLWLPLTAALGWIAAVDLDVQRIPNRALRPTAIWVGTCLMALAITDHTTAALVHAAIAAAGSLAGFTILHLASPGSLGFGDVKLATILGAAVGAVSLPALLIALLFACVLALSWAGATRTRQLAFGPWLAAGAILGVGLPGVQNALG
ncbi:MAG: prepilin peptidase [Brooklawnia sp.]|nr:prepilin peptidase [Brooklawnia sp.]